MSESFNQLSSAEAERLALLLEELGEAQQAIGKILRHGYESHYPERLSTNRQELEKELGDICAAIHILCERNKDLSSFNIAIARDEKIIKVEKYMHHQS